MQIIGEIQCDYVYVDNVVLGHLLLEAKLRSSPQVTCPSCVPCGTFLPCGTVTPYGTVAPPAWYHIRHRNPVRHGYPCCLRHGIPHSMVFPCGMASRTTSSLRVPGSDAALFAADRRG